MTAPRIEARDLGRPEFRTKLDLCQWIAGEAGVPVEVVLESRRAAAAAAGREFRADDPVGAVRAAGRHRLRSAPRHAVTTDTAAVAPAPETREAAGRLRRLFGAFS